MFEIFQKLFKYNNPLSFVIIAFIFTCVAGSVGVISGIPQGYLLDSFSTEDSSGMKSDMALFLPIIVGIGFTALLAQAIAMYCIYYLSARMIRTLRSGLFETIIKQPLQFFMQKDNSTGNLTSVLACDIRQVNGASVETYLSFFRGIIGMSKYIDGVSF